MQLQRKKRLINNKESWTYLNDANNKMKNVVNNDIMLYKNGWLFFDEMSK